MTTRGVTLAALAAIAGGVAAVAACLPELGALPADLPEEGGPPPSGPVCGNGVIEAYDGGAETCDPGDAAPPGCQGCQIACEGTLDPTTQHCYFAVGPEAVYMEAARLCQARGGHVVTIDSDGEERVVSGVADGGSYWIGLSATAATGAYGTQNAGVESGSEPGWPEPLKGTGPCRGCFGLGRDGGGFDPLDDAGAADAFFACVAASGGRWLGVPRIRVPALATICEREPAGQRSLPCGGAFCFTLPVTRKSYVLVNAGETFDQARRNCESFPSGRLVVLETREEREQLVREVLAVNPFPVVLEILHYWIGLSPDDAGTWTWAASAGDAAVPWADNEPVDSGVGATLRIAQQRYDTGLVAVEADPAERHPYICERAP